MHKVKKSSHAFLHKKRQTVTQIKNRIGRKLTPGWILLLNTQCSQERLRIHQQHNQDKAATDDELKIGPALTGLDQEIRLNPITFRLVFSFRDFRKIYFDFMIFQFL